MLPISHQSITFEENSPTTISLLIPHDLTLKVTHEDFVKLAAANRELRLKCDRNPTPYRVRMYSQGLNSS